ncbi:MAG TPA: hypothetical protein VGI81_27515 [Tepidisphaeraceae bacterium]|jgi:hypothetical protein
MSIDVTFENGKATFFSNVGWANLLAFAEEYGWTAARTGAPEEWDAREPWPGHYDPAEGQKITADDARRIAEALRKGLNDPDRQVAANRVAAKLSGELQSATSSPNATIQAFRFEERALAYWHEFILNALESGFSIG